MKRRFLSLFFGFFEKKLMDTLQQARPLSQSLTALPALPKGEPIAAQLLTASGAKKLTQSCCFPFRCVGSPFGGAVEQSETERVSQVNASALTVHNC